MRDEHGLTIKQRKYADGVLAGLEGAEAVVAAGYEPASKNALYVEAYRLAKHPNVRQYVLESLEQAGCTPQAVSLRLFQLMHTKVDQQPIESGRLSLEAIKEVNKMLGAHAPSESRCVRVGATYQAGSRAELRFLAEHGRKPTKAEREAMRGEE